jgi:hypothetical protein
VKKKHNVTTLSTKKNEKKNYNTLMSLSEALSVKAVPVSVEPAETSYFSNPQAGLDPRLFHNNQLIGSVRGGILRVLFEHLRNNYYTPEAYIYAWLAGSGVSYQWAANRTPADLDCLVGIDYIRFRQSNPKFSGLSDREIADMFNDDFRNDLQPVTESYLGSFELTFYVNVQSDIRNIKPYAAYSLTDNDWTVEPQSLTVTVGRDWERKVTRDENMAVEILSRYAAALAKIGTATSASARINAEATLKLAVEQGAALFEDIHHGRKAAFSIGGQGYLDYSNYRWQAGKSTGVVQALKQLKDLSKKTRQEFESQTYGMELPDASVLIRRAIASK